MCSSVCCVLQAASLGTPFVWSISQPYLQGNANNPASTATVQPEASPVTSSHFTTLGGLVRRMSDEIPMTHATHAENGQPIRWGRLRKHHMLHGHEMTRLNLPGRKNPTYRSTSSFDFLWLVHLLPWTSWSADMVCSPPVPNTHVPPLKREAPKRRMPRSREDAGGRRRVGPCDRRTVRRVVRVQTDGRSDHGFPSTKDGRTHRFQGRAVESRASCWKDAPASFDQGRP